MQFPVRKAISKVGNYWFTSQFNARQWPSVDGFHLPNAISVTELEYPIKLRKFCNTVKLG
ncbi:hypothetical protein FRX31_013581 [Thalictrum thalictroides]|uniref:Uncharacterized protein n=1 Tax=Thalictrum thalictroides TaxID=46969 RepID=A0A7J6WHJ0_THATH|nr:hypothetical protein FRX31_013581 [Thalictrum thalictroides]